MDDMDAIKKALERHKVDSEQAQAIIDDVRGVSEWQFTRVWLTHKSASDCLDGGKILWSEQWCHDADQKGIIVIDDTDSIEDFVRNGYWHETEEEAIENATRLMNIRKESLRKRLERLEKWEPRFEPFHA